MWRRWPIFMALSPKERCAGRFSNRNPSSPQIIDELAELVIHGNVYRTTTSPRRHLKSYCVSAEYLCHRSSTRRRFHGHHATRTSLISPMLMWYEFTPKSRSFRPTSFSRWAKSAEGVQIVVMRDSLSSQLSACSRILPAFSPS